MQIDHVELRVADPAKAAQIFVGLFGGEVTEINPSLVEVRFADGAFLKLKVGNPTPESECNRAIGRLAFAVADTEAILPQIRLIDPEAKDLGWINVPEPARRIVQFSVCGVLCHTIERVHRPHG